MSWLAASVPASFANDIGELVFFRDIPQGASMFECLRVAWDEARSEVHRAYEAWLAKDGLDAYAVYRAAQDRADAAQDALAECAAPGAVTDRR
jgi:hypothetical protein